MKKYLEEKYPIFFIAAFIGLLLLPLRGTGLNIQTLDESFYSRERLITFANDFRILIGDRVFPNVLIGPNHWLVFTAEHSLDDYQNTIPLSDGDLSLIQKSLDEFNMSLRERGITLLVVIPPDKNTIYPEYVPEGIPVIGQESRLDQLINFMNTNGQTRILDLRPALLQAKQTKQIYYTTDTHWNELGMFIGYREIMTALESYYPQLKPLPESDFRLSSPRKENLDLAQNIGTDLFPENVVILQPQFNSNITFKTFAVGQRKVILSYNPNSSLPKAVIYHDSFFFTMIPLLSEHFSHAVYVQNYLGGGLWNTSWVDEEKPDIVIIEFTERYLQGIPTLLKKGNQ